MNAAVKRALSGWRFQRQMRDANVVIWPHDWQSRRSGTSVGVMVRIDAKKAAMNLLMHLTGFAWTDEKICGQYVMRKE